MTARGLYTLLFGGLMFAVSLSVGSAGAMLMGGAALIAWTLSLACTVLAALLCRVEQQVESSKAERTGVCRYTLTARLPLPLPLRTALAAGATGMGGMAVLLQNRALYPRGLVSLGEQVLWQVLHGAASFLLAMGLMLLLTP